MNDKKKMSAHTGRNVLLIAAVLICTILIALQPNMHVYAEDESDVNASVTVVSGTPESCGARVISSRNVMWRWFSLGMPDNRGAFMSQNGWIVIKLADTVTDCGEVHVHAANMGWKSSQMYVQVSADGWRWKNAGHERVTFAHFRDYEFNGNFGEVRYIKVRRQGTRWSFLLLDAVCAKGGGA